MSEPGARKVETGPFHGKVPLTLTFIKGATLTHHRVCELVSFRDLTSRNDAGCFESIANLAARLGIDRSNCRKALRDLVDWGVLSREPSATHSTDVFRVIIGEVTLPPPGAQLPPPSKGKTRGAQLPRGGGAATSQGEAQLPPKEDYEDNRCKNSAEAARSQANAERDGVPNQVGNNLLDGLSDRIAHLDLNAQLAIVERTLKPISWDDWFTYPKTDRDQLVVFLDQVASDFAGEEVGRIAGRLLDALPYEGTVEHLPADPQSSIPGDRRCIDDAVSLGEVVQFPRAKAATAQGSSLDGAIENALGLVSSQADLARQLGLQPHHIHKARAGKPQGEKIENIIVTGCRRLVAEHNEWGSIAPMPDLPGCITSRLKIKYRNFSVVSHSQKLLEVSHAARRAAECGDLYGVPAERVQAWALWMGERANDDTARRLAEALAADCAQCVLEPRTSAK